MGYILTLTFIVGIMVGYGITLFKKADGRFVIDLTNPEKDLYSLELDCDLEKLPSRRSITLKINNSYK